MEVKPEACNRESLSRFAAVRYIGETVTASAHCKGEVEIGGWVLRGEAVLLDKHGSNPLYR